MPREQPSPALASRQAARPAKAVGAIRRSGSGRLWRERYPQHARRVRTGRHRETSRRKEFAVPLQFSLTPSPRGRKAREIVDRDPPALRVAFNDEAAPAPFPLLVAGLSECYSDPVSSQTRVHAPRITTEPPLCQDSAIHAHLTYHSAVTGWRPTRHGDPVRSAVRRPGTGVSRQVPRASLAEGRGLTPAVLV
jgi:hypothetical protein